MDFKNNLKIGLSSVGKMYIVCALIQNVITCLYGLSLPTIHEYFFLNLIDAFNKVFAYMFLTLLSYKIITVS